MDTKCDAVRRNFIIDEELDLFDGCGEGQVQTRDLLNTATYVTTLINCVMDAPEDKPFTIGLFGEWGSGKSSIIKTFSRVIADKYAANQKRVRVITYDAWKYSNDSFRRMFLLRMQEDLGFKRQELMDSFYLNSSEDAHIDTKFNWRELFLGFIIVVLVVLAICKYGVSSDFKIAANAIVAFGSLAYAIFRGAFREIKVNIQRPHFFAPEQFEACFNEMCDKALSEKCAVKEAYKYIKGETGVAGLHRLIIVIDNIDRCSPELAYELLTNIKNFLGKKHNNVFIVPVDEDALKKHIISRNTTRVHEADEFLRKFFNLCIRIKPFHQEEMFDFADQLNSKYGMGLNSNTIGLISQEFVSNPRRIIQIMNNLIAEFQSVPQDYVENDESLICKLLIIREEFPEFYNALLRDATLLFNDKEQAIYVDKDESLKQFLYRTSSISNSYRGHIDRVEGILSNSIVFNKIPNAVLEEINSDDIKETKAYISDSYNKDKLLNYVLHKIRVNIERMAYQSGVSLYLNYLMRISDKCELNYRDYVRISDIVKDLTLSRYFRGEVSMRPFVVFAQKMSEKSQSELNNKLKDLLLDEVQCQFLSKEMVRDGVFFGYTIWEGSMLSALKSKLGKCYEEKPEEIFNYDYGYNKEAVFSGSVLDKIIKAQFKENQLVEDGENLFVKLVNTFTIEENSLAAAISKVAEMTTKYKNNSTEKQQIERFTDYLTKVLSTFPNDYVLKDSASLSSFIEKACHIYSETPNYGRPVKRAYYLDIRDQEKQKRFVDFFFQVSRITQKPLIPSRYLKLMLSVSETFLYIEQSLNNLLAYRFPFSDYSVTICEIGTITSELLTLYDSLFVEKIGSEYLISDDIVSQKLRLVLSLLLNEDSSLKAESEKLMLSLFKDVRCANILINIISEESSESIQGLPPSIHKLIIPIFSEHFDDYSDKMSIMHVMASASNAQMQAKVVRKIVNMLTTHGKEKDAFSLIKELKARDKKQTAMLVSTLEAMSVSDTLQKERDECLALLN